VKIVATSDLHGFLPKIPKANLLLIAGDIVPRKESRQEKQQEWLLNSFRPWINRQEVEKVFFTAGNHDLGLEDLVWAKANFPEYKCLETVDFNGLKIFFSPYSLSGLDLAFQAGQKEIKKIFKNIPLNTDIIVSHGPIKGILDSELPQFETGFDALDIVKKIKPKLFISGHIHNAFGSRREAETLFLNSSFCSTKKIPAHPLWVLNWQHGVKNLHQELPIAIDVTKVSDRLRYGKIDY
jgi:Icc-related predicted phosphoesterase